MDEGPDTGDANFWGDDDGSGTLQQYRTLVNLVDDGIYQLDAEGRFVAVNDVVVEMSGYAREDLLGESVSLLLDENDLQRIQQEISRRLATGEHNTRTFELAVHAADEQRIPCELRVSLLVEDGEFRGTVGIARDISTEERGQELLRKERQYDAIFNGPNILVGLLEPDGIVLDVNETAMEYIDADLDAVTGEPFWETPWWDDSAEADPRGWIGRAASGEYVDFEGDLADPSGEQYTVSGSFRPVTDDDGDVTSVMAMAQDITEQKERERDLQDAKAQLEASNERLEQFAYAVSHDLQEPLRMVTSYLQLVEQRYAGALDDDGREFIDFAVDGADRMREMIDGLLKYSRVETEGETFEPVDLDDVLAAVCEDLTVKIEEQDADVTVDSLPTVEGDASQLRQVFQNLLDNAIEYSGDEPPQVDVSAERRGDEWRISVHDEGIGIDPEDADRVFEVFQRLHSQDEYAGTGIGLALCKRIVERHGGDIWVDSVPGEGSTFSFELPAADA